MKSVTNMVLDRKLYALKARLRLVSKLSGADRSSLALRREKSGLTVSIDVLQEVRKDINKAFAHSSK